jgi:hypothetical protein
MEKKIILKIEVKALSESPPGLKQFEMSIWPVDGEWQL